ncbi:MAG TPA: M13 family metallopeptidase [Bryobacteraceae bacterium]|nr:M13 family metallopeptidase [Bryobacteraceae bacterium]
MVTRRLIGAALLAAISAGAQSTGFNVANIDKSAEPCSNFFQYACGNWIKNNPIPSDRSRWSRFEELAARNENILLDILQTSAVKTNGSPIEQKIGAYYTACMDEKGIEAKGLTPIKSELDRIAALKDKSGLADLLERQHAFGAAPLFNFYARVDYKNSQLMIGWLDQSGLGLPDRDYYFRDDAKSAEIRTKYVDHVTRMFSLAGYDAAKAASAAKAIMSLETALAKASQDRVARRNANNLNHPDTVDGLKALTPAFDWKRYFDKSGTTSLRNINIANPEFFKILNELITTTTLDDLKTYLTWHLLRVAAPTLPSAFVNEDFDFNQRVLTGAKEMRPRSKRCIIAVDRDLGEALGQKYVELAFAGNSKAKMLDMVRGLEKAMAEDIRQIDWMTPETKKRAIEKLEAITEKIGYPEKWLDYSKLAIASDDALGNLLRANEFETRRNLDKIGKPPNPKEWSMSPPTVNAYYSSQLNSINFPAGILQPPFFDAKLDDAVNYGGIGAVIGHELTHGFDDSGRRFDAKGNLLDWWTPADGKEFEKRASCMEKQYSEYVAIDDVRLNGKLTLGENVADNGGLRIALMAYLASIAQNRPDKIDGYTPEQRFFLGWGQVWCSSMTPEAERLRAQTDPHSPGRYRVNGVLSNMPEFQQAFGCKIGQPMVRGDNACKVW